MFAWPQFVNLAGCLPSQMVASLCMVNIRATIEENVPMSRHICFYFHFTGVEWWFPADLRRAAASATRAQPYSITRRAATKTWLWSLRQDQLKQQVKQQATKKQFKSRESPKPTKSQSPSIRSMELRATKLPAVSLDYLRRIWHLVFWLRPLQPWADSLSTLSLYSQAGQQKLNKEHCFKQELLGPWQDFMTVFMHLLC